MPVIVYTPSNGVPTPVIVTFLPAVNPWTAAVVSVTVFVVNALLLTEATVVAGASKKM